MDKDIKVQDLNFYCRTCLVECEGNKHDVEQLPRAVFQLFKQVTGFPKNHNKFFPKWICESCCFKINSFAEFQVMSKKSTQFLEELIKSYIVKNLVKDIGNKDQSKDECSNESSKFFYDFSSDNNKEEKSQSDEILLEKSPFENVFLQTEIKNHFEIVQQISSSTDALSSTNAENSNEKNIKIEENVKDEGYNKAVVKDHMRNHRDQKSFRYDKHDDEEVDAASRVICKYNCGETFSDNTSALAHYQNNHSTIALESSLFSDEASSGESSDENLSLLVKFKKYLSKKTCSICNKTYASAAKLRSHMLSHEKRCRFQCDQCTESFQRKIRLKEHMREIHAEKLLEINCKFDCGKTFMRLETALAHYRSKHNITANLTSDTKPNELPCGETKESEKTTIDEAAKSSIVNVLTALNKTTCQICFRNYSSEQKLKIHTRLHEEKRPFQCDHCERSFNEKARFKRHVAENHTNNVTEIACKFGCGKTFRRLDTVKKHYYLKHSSTDKQIKRKTYTFICENCGRMFKNITAMREHSYTHRPVEDQPYKCDECSKSFTSKRSYKEHLTRHLGIKNYECPHCGLKKTTRKELKNHLNIHTKEKVYNCSVCAKVFNRMSGLKLHERVVHQGIRLYNCSYCDQSFGKPDTLKHHEMRHTGEKPHKCQNCDRSFIQVVALRAHMKTHNK